MEGGVQEEITRKEAPGSSNTTSNQSISAAEAYDSLKENLACCWLSKTGEQGH